ncbi:MAG TPA: hypothetical protein VGI40_01355 [Pirellulaceae bacterium]
MMVEQLLPVATDAVSSEMDRDMQTAEIREDVTRLSLLTRDGAVAVEFNPALDTQHYAELFQIAGDFDSELELRAIVQKAAQRWGRMVCFG